MCPLSCSYRERMCLRCVGALLFPWRRWLSTRAAFSCRHIWRMWGIIDHDTIVECGTLYFEAWLVKHTSGCSLAGLALVIW